jgi:outer membrane protein assembly factor BamB
MKKVTAVAAVALLLVLGSAVGYVLYKWHEGRNIRGSSTQEFVTTPIRPRQKPAGVVWPMYGYDGQRVRAVSGFGVKPPFRELWRFRAKALLEFPPAVAYGRLFVANNPGVLYALDAGSGRVRWRYNARRCTAASPAVAKRIVYETFLNRPPCNAEGSDLDGQIVALDTSTGKVRWRRTIGPSESSPLVARGAVYVGDWRGKVYAINARTGRTLWTFSTDGKVKGGVAISGQRLYIGSYDGHVYALNALTGRLIWRASAQARLGPTGTFYATPAVAYDRVYIGSTDSKVYSFGASTGRLHWSYGTGGYVYSSPAVWRLRVYIGSVDGHLYCFDAATGRVRWRFEANGAISGSPTVIDGVVYFASLRGRTYALNARTGKLLWFFRDGQYTPVVAGTKRLYLVGHTRVYAFAPKRSR